MIAFPAASRPHDNRLNPGDAALLSQALPSLPADDTFNGRVTLDLNGRVVLQAQGATASRTSELILSNSKLQGSPVRLSSNRQYLARAMQLGFRELQISSSKAPIVCRDRQRRYCWALLPIDSLLPATEDPIVVNSPSEPESRVT